MILFLKKKMIHPDFTNAIVMLLDLSVMEKLVVAADPGKDKGEDGFHQNLLFFFRRFFLCCKIKYIITSNIKYNII